MEYIGINILLYMWPWPLKEKDQTHKCVNLEIKCFKLSEESKRCFRTWTWPWTWFKFFCSSLFNRMLSLRSIIYIVFLCSICVCHDRVIGSPTTWYIDHKTHMVMTVNMTDFDVNLIPLTSKWQTFLIVCMRK